MTINSMPGLIAIVGGIVIFLGSSYLVLALNTGWRFGYWIWGASLGGLMLFLSTFWVLTGLGPRGEEAEWVPIAADQAEIGSVELNEVTFESPGRYPSGDWEPAEEDGALAEEVDALSSSLSSCFQYNPERVEAAHEEIEDLKAPERTFLELRIGVASRAQRELEVCERAFAFLPTDDELPTAAGDAVSFVNDVENVRFTEEEGVTLAQAVIVPNTYDPRVTGDEEGEEALQVGDPFRVVAYKDPGSLRTPAVMYLVVSLLWFGFHLWRLDRAEKEKLSPLVE